MIMGKIQEAVIITPKPNSIKDSVSTGSNVISLNCSLSISFKQKTCPQVLMKIIIFGDSLKPTILKVGSSVQLFLNCVTVVKIAKLYHDQSY